MSAFFRVFHLYMKSAVGKIYISKIYFSTRLCAGFKNYEFCEKKEMINYKKIQIENCIKCLHLCY